MKEASLFQEWTDLHLLLGKNMVKIPQLFLHPAPRPTYMYVTPSIRKENMCPRTGLPFVQ